MVRFTVAALALLFAALAPAHAGTTGSLVGRVDRYDDNSSHTSAPANGATITLESPSEIRSAITDANGRFAILDLIPGRYRATVTSGRMETVLVPEVQIAADCQSTVRVIIFHRLRTANHVISSNMIWDRPRTMPEGCGFIVTPETLPTFDSSDRLSQGLQMVPGVYVTGNDPP